MNGGAIAVPRTARSTVFTTTSIDGCTIPGQAERPQDARDHTAPEDPRSLGSLLVARFPMTLAHHRRHRLGVGPASTYG